LMPIVGALAVEGVVALTALVSLGILFGLRKKFAGQSPAESQDDALLYEPTSFD